MAESSPVLVINGTDFTKLVQTGGLQWTRNDIDANNSGRDMKGRMRRKRIASKAKLQVTCKPLTTTQLRTLNTALFHETVSVRYLDPRVGLRTATFYGSEVSAAVMMREGDVTMWEGVAFSITEV